MNFFAGQFEVEFVPIFFHKLINVNFKNSMINLNLFINLNFKIVNFPNLSNLVYEIKSLESSLKKDKSLLIE